MYTMLRVYLLIIYTHISYINNKIKIFNFYSWQTLNRYIIFL